MHRLELKLPPPVVFAVTALAMWLIARQFPALSFGAAGHGPVPDALSIALVLAGAALGLAAIVGFRRARTTVEPRRPHEASAIVTRGVYRLTRNPMYLGLLCLLAAWALRLAHPLPWLLLPVFVGWITRFQIVPEERVLAARFGATYADYRRAVRRWI